MRMRTLGGTGIKVSPYCLGAMMFGAWGNPDHEDGIRIIHARSTAGINFVDTADVYSAGESEEIVGKALQGPPRRGGARHQVPRPDGRGPEPAAATRAAGSCREVENSLRRLGTDYIDLYQMHRPDPDTDIDETLGGADRPGARGQGPRRSARSTFPAEQIVEAQWVAERRGLERFRMRAAAVLDPRPRHRGAVLPACERYGMGVIVWSPLDGGLAHRPVPRGRRGPPTGHARRAAAAALRPVAAREPAQARRGRAAR